MIKMIIASPAEWQNNMCESLEARTYYEGEFVDSKKAAKWLYESITKVMGLDPIHGNRFILYINNRYVGDINRVTGELALAD